MSPPVQPRALRTRQKILDALQTLLAAREFETLSIADIAAEAGVAVGTVYTHFEDKAALLPALLDRRLATIEARIDQLADDGTLEGIDLREAGSPDLRTLLDAMLRAALRQVREDRGAMRALLTWSRLHPEAGQERRARLAERGFELFVARLAAHRHEISHPDLRAAARMVNHFVNVAFLGEAVFQRPPMPPSLVPDDDARIAAYTTMLHAWLTTPR